MRVLVCGGRTFNDSNLAFETLDEICKDARATVIIHGGALGADELAKEWAIVNWASWISFPADWEAHGRAAGPIRNQAMLDEGKPDLVIAFPGGRGTADMVRRARGAGVKVIEVEKKGARYD